VIFCIVKKRDKFSTQLFTTGETSMSEDRAKNPFEVAKVASVPAAQNAVAAADSNRQIAEVQAAMMIARANPRDPIAAVDRILNACSRPGLAESGMYQYSRGGTDITGPSIRLAEAIAQQWGNFQFGIRELEQRPSVVGHPIVQPIGGVSTVHPSRNSPHTGAAVDQGVHVVPLPPEPGRRERIPFRHVGGAFHHAGIADEV
jgi:hypothetical protein